MGDSHLRRGWSVERSSGNANAPWQIIHIATGLPVPVLRPYPGVEKLPPIWVQNHRSKPEAEKAAAELDWANVGEILSTPEALEHAKRYREKKAFDEAYQLALTEARAGREPWPWEPGGLLHRDVVELEQPLTLFEVPRAA
jgi:hypothetical protein